MRLLLVDDEEQVIKAYLRVLRRKPNLEVVGVQTPQAALDHLLAGAFDAAVVDHHLGEGESGITLLRQIAEEWPATRRLLCTGGTISEEDVLVTAHAHGVLYKPATVEELLEAVGYDESAQRITRAVA